MTLQKNNHSLQSLTFPSIFEIFKNIIKDLDVKLSYVSVNKLDKFIKTHKDILPITSKKNVVYKINCKDCEAFYVDQTKRQLKIIFEHRNHINRNTSTFSVIGRTEHRKKLNHDWKNIEILNNERFLSKPIFDFRDDSYQNHSLNLQTDIDYIMYTLF